MKLVCTTVLVLFLFACVQPVRTERHAADSVARAPAVNQEVPPLQEKGTDSLRQGPSFKSGENTDIEVKTFVNNSTDDANGTWGYDIYINHTKSFHQPSIPAVPGIRGFATEAKALKAGEFVAYKLKHNIQPPAVSPRELDSLGTLQ